MDRPLAHMAVSALTLLATVLAGCGEGAPRGSVHVLTVDEAVDRVLPLYLARGIDRAEHDGAAAVLVRINTPGGSADAMRDALGVIQEARVPVMTYVSPAGGHAASAGTFLVMAGHVAAMAPGTTIGAAKPVTATGGDIEGTLGEKVTNDVAALARAVAEMHGRNAGWAERAVREAVSASAAEALELRVIDLVAADVEHLLGEVDGRSVRLSDGQEVTLATRGARLVQTGVNAYERVLRIVGDPLAVTLLLIAGIGLVYLETQAPGLFVPGSLGVLALLVALVGIGSLLPQEAARLLLVGGLALIVLEVFLPGGIVGSIGAVALLTGIAVLLAGSTAFDLRMAVLVIGLVVTALGLVTGVALAMLARRYIAPTERTGGARL